MQPNNGRDRGPIAKSAETMMAKVLKGIERNLRDGQGVRAFDTDGDGDPELVVFHRSAIPEDLIQDPAEAADHDD
ncbi:MAG: hypothetical protein SVU88_03450 [Candidatus Nanohaloarchaea archaeon]|nr:hypothetical protein [Candidatus Nanohaloarchaea archaeon]